ncbi:MAG: M14 family zinc carboxypeptidase [Candidatus Thalassarchaeaceae archaeon]|nr:M14 family zinc carboxypeptidase [Candidatus Thalassarchaeaceae archaeon]MDP6844981.1 M14 family zinc carboxypeptidase [Candidatus Thalassarchaeaceae archaeon]
MSSRRIPALLGILCMLLPMLIGSISMNSQDDPPEGLSPGDIWSDDYAAEFYPWGGNDRMQFKEYHDYFTMRDRMMELAEENSYIMSFHEGLNGGTNARGMPMTADSYKGHFYSHPSPWMKITNGGENGGGVQGGDCNEFVGDCGNYAEIPDVQLVGNHHAREWMSYEVPMFFLETVAHYYGQAGIDNDGDGLVDEDGWGDDDGDGILDDDGDCLSLASNFQDSNGDGLACGPGDLGVDEDFSEQQITTLVQTREIYLIPMLNVDGNRYDREVFCGEDAWNCDSAGWRKNLRDNTVTGVTPIPDVDEEVDEGCDGVDLNRNYQFEWGAPLGATGPLFPGMCYAGANNDVYNGPVDDTDNDGDGQINEDHVDGKDDDADGLTDEDWWGGNSEPETRFIQDLTEMNDDDGDGASDYRVTLTWHSYSELVLYPWGHCTDCETPDHGALIYHGDKMAEMTRYENMQSSDLYPTTGDYCDWHYGVHDSFCYTIEIGTAFHQHPSDIDHIAVRNLGIPFYMIEIADNPRERAALGVQEFQWIVDAANLTIPDSGPIPITMCLDPAFPYTNDDNFSHVMWRTVKPSRQQSDFGAKEWVTEDWHMTGFQETGENCTLNNNDNGTLIVANLPVPEDFSGKLHYKSMIGTRDGTFPFSYPKPEGGYEEISIAYRAPYGNGILAFLLFCIVAGTVWGSLGLAIKKMNESDTDEPSIVGALD